MQEALENLKMVETALQGRKFFGGEAIRLVDIIGNFFAYCIEMIQGVTGAALLDGEKLPILHQWAEEFVNTSVVKERLPPRDKLLAFFKARKEAYTNAAKGS